MDTLKSPYAWPDILVKPAESEKDHNLKDTHRMDNLLLIQAQESFIDREGVEIPVYPSILDPDYWLSHVWERIRFQWISLYWVSRNLIKGAAKRALDITICVLALPFILPIMLIVSLAIRLESRGGVIFKQERIGKWGKPFLCLKFRSMVVDAEARKSALMASNDADEVIFKMKRDPRVTRVGQVIRKLSIDELPQVFNVLKGEMSFVGPRPPVPVEVQQYKVDYLRRLEVLPGITGLQQVSGRSDLEFKRWVELDVQYIRESCLLKDLEILLKTIPAVISQKGAY